MSEWFYQTVLLLARPLVHLRLKWRARREVEYGQRQQERFGHVPQTLSRGPVWFHTVSAGETIAAAPLIMDLTEQYPDLPFLVTTMTPTGSAQVIERLGDHVEHCYAPYDFKDGVKRFFDRVQPRVLILMETELWPNILAQAAARQVPVMLVNARLSARSARGYARLAGLTRTMLSRVEHIACQTTEHRDRFIGLGAEPRAVTVTGSVKYDVSLPENYESTLAALRERFGMHASDPIWIAASTHPGEDEIVLAAHQVMVARIPQLRLVLVPRHPVRCDEVISLVTQAGLTAVRQSVQVDAGSTQAQQAEVLIGDVMGSLQQLYGLARVAYVGGSLVDVGGHNPIEPALAGVPVVCGPFQHNFADVMAHMAAAGGLQTVTSAEDLARAVGDWLERDEARQVAAEAALRVVDNNRGAQARVRALVCACIDRAVAE